MASLPLSDETLAAAVELFSIHGTYAQAARSAGISDHAFRNRLNRAAERGLMGTKPVLPGFRIKQTSRQTGPEGELEREWVQQAPERGEAFALPDGHLIKGVSALVDADGRTIQQWIKTRADTSVPDLVEALKATFEDYKAHVDAALMSVYPIADQHNGLLAWAKETGESYDLKIGANRLRSCASRLIAQSPASKLALILNLGDWQHTDDQRNVTPAHGHQLDVDSRYFKILKTGIRLYEDLIELALQKHDTVEVVNIPGNHDPMASIALTVALAAFYHNNPRVLVYEDPADVYFRRFGATLIGATHGHNMKPERMAMTMATRNREAWGATLYHWFLFGHIHHETVKEVGDVRCESFQTLAAMDAHAHKGGYNAGKSLNSITLHMEEGEIGRHRINVPPPTRSPA
jgi:predicted phosphodiesterase